MRKTCTLSRKSLVTLTRSSRRTGAYPLSVDKDRGVWAPGGWGGGGGGRCRKCDGASMVFFLCHNSRTASVGADMLTG